MQRHLFLTGPTGCGKSTMIKNALGDKLGYAGGYMTVPSLNADGQFTGLDLIPSAAGAGIDGYERAQFLSFTESGAHTDNEVFRNEGVRLLKEAEYYPFAVVDEFGGFELIIPQFRNALLELLNSELPCIGVIKTEDDGEAMRSTLGLGEKYSGYLHALHESLAADEDTLVIETDGNEDENAINLLNQWIKEYFP